MKMILKEEHWDHMRLNIHVSASMFPKPSAAQVLLSTINVAHNNLPTYQDIRNWE
jgi:hypothetical protein